MNVKPIPDSLLGDSAELLIPNGSGYDITELDNVRVERTSCVSDYSSQRMRDRTEITVWFDLESSYPADTEFAAGQKLRYLGEEFEVLEARTFIADSPHHVRIKGTLVKRG